MHDEGVSGGHRSVVDLGDGFIGSFVVLDKLRNF
jgi:hypothetical protein